MQIPLLWMRMFLLPFLRKSDRETSHFHRSFTFHTSFSVRDGALAVCLASLRPVALTWHSHLTVGQRAIPKPCTIQRFKALQEKGLTLHLLCLLQLDAQCSGENQLISFVHTHNPLNETMATKLHFELKAFCVTKTCPLNN